MDPEKRFTCGQLLQHPYFDGFTNEFDRERKEQQKQFHREQQKLLQQSKYQNNMYATGGGPTKQNPGVSLFLCSMRIYFNEKKEMISIRLEMTD